MYGFESFFYPIEKERKAKRLTYNEVATREVSRENVGGFFFFFFSFFFFFLIAR